MLSNLKAELLLSERHALDENTFIELEVWRVPKPVRGSAHSFKYRIALVTNGACVLRCDNEAGKGDHKHLGDKQVAYAFRGLDALRADFMADVRTWRRKCEP